MKYPLNKTDHSAALKIIAVYAVFAALWIFLSDEALGLLIKDPAVIVHLSVFKGFLFILVTAAILYKLIVRYAAERKRVEEAHEATIELLRICNGADSKRGLMKMLMLFFQNYTGCEAVGVRLKEGDDFPYFETRGFSDSFVQAESSLCAYDRKGELLRDTSGNPIHECMCGNVITGRFDPVRPFFTARGSFWTNSTTDLLGATTDKERLARTRNRCHGEGFESVALVPLRVHGETFGLFQFNDRRRGLFSAAKIALFEDLVTYVAISLAKLLADEALLESGEFSRQIINSAEEGIIVYDRQIRFQVWNPYMERITGRSAGDVIGKEPAELFPFLGEAGILENIRKALAGERVVSAEFNYSSPITGVSHWMSDVCVPLRNSKGEIIGVIGRVLDITERKRAEEELMEATQRLQLAVASGQLGIWDWDIDKNTLVWNDRMYELYGVPREYSEINRKTWEECLHPDDLITAMEETRKAVAGEKDYELEFRVIHPDGSMRFIRSNATVIRESGGRAVRMIGMNQDITERKLLEEQLRQSQKMEAIGQLAGGVAHDFNNILTVIYGYCNVLQMKMAKDAPFRAEVDHIYAAAERAAGLTRSLLAFSRKQIMNPKKVNLNDIVLNVGKLLTRIIGEDVQLKTITTGKPLMILADSGQLEQVLMNLAANARDAMAGGGLLTIETASCDIDEGFVRTYGYGAAGKYAILTVTDTGKGMDAETSKKIFEPFFTTKDVGKGTGLGLAIVYGVVKQHNGYINVDSEPTRGTSFRIYLPQVSTENADHIEEADPAYPRAGSETILVAEDDAAIREIMESVLRKFGYEVLLACNGAEAVEKFKTNQGRIALTVMDMVMPGMGGKEAYEEIRKLRDTAKVLFISGYSPVLLHDRGFFTESFEVLVKPIPPLELVRKVREMLDNVNSENGELR